MNLWTKITQSIQKGTEKAADLVEEGMEKMKAPQVDAIELGKFQNEVEELRKTVVQKFTALGSHVYDLYTADKQDVIVAEIETDAEELQILKKELSKKELELEEIFKDYEDQSISMNKLKAFKEELEAADSAIEYFTVDEEASYVGSTLSEIEFPDDLLLGLVIHEGKAIIPSGETQINIGDKIMLMGKKEAVIEALYKFSPKTEEPQSNENA